MYNNELTDDKRACLASSIHLQRSRADFDNSHRPERQYMNNNKLDSKPAGRIGWVDIAKGIAIILVIYGHCFDNNTNPGNPIRTLIFSFHMPLFFILSGYTFRPKPWCQIITSGARKLLLTYAALFALWRIPNLLMTADHVGRSLIISHLLSFVFASGVDIYSLGISAAGMSWFLACLFVSRLIYNGISCAYQTSSHKTALEGLTCTIIMLVGVFLGRELTIYLPLSSDVAFVAVFFMWCGNAVRTHLNTDAVLRVRYGIITFAIWVVCSQYSSLELAARSYENLPVALLAAISGTHMICCAAKLLDSDHLPKLLHPARKYLLFMGKNSMAVYCIHSMDWWVSWFSLPALAGYPFTTEITALVRVGYASIFTKLAKTF